MCNTMACPNHDGPDSANAFSVLSTLTVDGKCSDHIPNSADIGRCTIVASTFPSSAVTAGPTLDKKAFSCRCRNQPTDKEIKPETICGSTVVCPNAYEWWGASVINTPVYMPMTKPASASATTTASTKTATTQT